ncbi:MAG: protein involved in polysaccharide export with SLBB domain [Arenicella sp.]|jgi:protein involved in polysaccharide export with SLBB domain
MKVSQTMSCLSLACLLLSGCAVLPKQLDNRDQDDGHHFARQIEGVSVAIKLYERAGLNANDHAYDLNQQLMVRGDILSIKIAGLKDFDGLYQITEQNTIELPFADAVSTAGLTRPGLIEKIKTELIRLEWFYQDYIGVDVSIVSFAPVDITVAGSVFNPGRVSINNRPALKQKEQISQKSGAFSPSRNLISAIQAAGGIRPDADLQRVYLKRGASIIRIPLANILNGEGFIGTPSLINGDEIIVASTKLENIDLIKPSQITPPGMRVLMSNLTAPSLSNAQAAVGSDSTRLPYGASLLDSAISANCVGGTQSANASRSVILITRNYGSTQQLVVRRSIDQLLANSSNHSVNPYLMPNDGVACYDSRFTNFRDVARGIGELVGPIVLGGLL